MSTKPWQPILKQILTQQIEAQKGLDQFKELIKSNPKDTSILGRYSGLLYHYKAFMDLPEIIEQIQNAEPESLLIPYFTALVNLDLGFPDETVKIFNKMQAVKKELKPIEMLYKALLLRRLSRPLEALKLIDTFLNTEEGKDDLEALLEKIQLHLEARQSKEALDLANKLLKDDPKNAEFRFYKAIALRGINETNIAITELTILLSDITDPKRKGLIYLERARCRPPTDLNGKLGDLDEAKKLNPNHEVDREIIISYYMGNKMEESDKLIEKLEENHNINNDYQMLLIKGSALRYIKKDYKKALEIYKRVSELAPGPLKEHFNKQIKVLEEKVKH